MKKVMFIIMMALIFAAGQSLAQNSDSKPVNAGNKICPIMGAPVNLDNSVKVEYKGKIYNLCCMGCKGAFLQDPEAALKKLAEIEVKK